MQEYYYVWCGDVCRYTTTDLCLAKREFALAKGMTEYKYARCDESHSEEAFRIELRVERVDNFGSVSVNILDATPYYMLKD